MAARMRRVTYMPHMADQRMHLEADKLEELFRAGLEGLAELLRPGACGENGAAPLMDRIALKAPDMTYLLIDYLSRLLSLSHLHGAVFCKVEVDRLDETGLDCRVRGRRVDRFQRDIKAVAYHEAEVRNLPDGRWETMVVFDV